MPRQPLHSRRDRSWPSIAMRSRGLRDQRGNDGPAQPIVPQHATDGVRGRLFPAELYMERAYHLTRTSLRCGTTAWGSIVFVSTINFGSPGEMLLEEFLIPLD